MVPPVVLYLPLPVLDLCTDDIFVKIMYMYVVGIKDHSESHATTFPCAPWALRGKSRAHQGKLLLSLALGWNISDQHFHINGLSIQDPIPYVYEVIHLKEYMFPMPLLNLSTQSCDKITLPVGHAQKRVMDHATSVKVKPPRIFLGLRNGNGMVITRSGNAKVRSWIVKSHSRPLYGRNTCI